MENEFVPIKKGEDEAYPNKMELESGPKTLMGFLMQTPLDPCATVPEPGDDCGSVHRQQCYLNMDDIMVKVHALGEEIPTEIEVEADCV